MTGRSFDHTEMQHQRIISRAHTDKAANKLTGRSCAGCGCFWQIIPLSDRVACRILKLMINAPTDLVNVFCASETQQ